jgi:SepF-like predicted cell division protein (DUF552 family)
MFKVYEAKEKVEIPQPERPKPKIWIRVDNLAGLSDVDRISRRVKEGYILFLRMVELQKKDLGQFKKTISRLKRECERHGWDMVALVEGYLLIVPAMARIIK